MKDNPWLLPDGIEEVLPAEAHALESVRRRVLDLFNTWGYRLVIPPFVEYLESLLTGTGSDLDLQTFKVTDQLSGRTLGIRADMTPQVARIDAQRLRNRAATRLCYIGTVLRTRSDSITGSRSPLQLGAELYGDAGAQSDIEILCLMLELLQALEIKNIHIDLGHVGIFRGLARGAGLQSQQELQLFEMLQRKALPEIKTFLQNTRIGQPYRQMLAGLVSLNGELGILAEARRCMRTAVPEVLAAIDYLEQVASEVTHRIPGIEVHIDLAELRGYHYKTGIVFAAFVSGQGQEVARGGRYDDIAHVFGNSRPATGFSADLKMLLSLMPKPPQEPAAIYAPAEFDADLQNTIADLRRQGMRVICGLSTQDTPQALRCDRILVKQGSTWQIEML